MTCSFQAFIIILFFLQLENTIVSFSLWIQVSEKLLCKFEINLKICNTRILMEVLIPTLSVFHPYQKIPSIIFIKLYIRFNTSNGIEKVFQSPFQPLTAHFHSHIVVWKPVCLCSHNWLWAWMMLCGPDRKLGGWEAECGAAQPKFQTHL